MESIVKYLNLITSQLLAIIFYFLDLSKAIAECFYFDYVNHSKSRKIQKTSEKMLKKETIFPEKRRFLK